MDQLISLYERWIHVPRWQKWILILLLGAVVGIFIYYFKIVPLKEVLKQKQNQAESLALTINRLKLVEKRKELLLKELEDLRNKIQQIEAKLPSGKEEVSQIVKSITDSDSGMVIKSIRREESVRHRYYIEYPYQIELIGTYPKYIEWCEKLSKADRIINFGSMKLKSISKVGSKSRRDTKIPKDATVDIVLKIKAFTLME